MTRQRHEFGGCSELHRAAIMRIADARALRASGRYTGAMYLRGYGLECLLKARLMEYHRVRTIAELDDLFSELRSNPSRSHSLESLFAALNLTERLAASPGRQALRDFHVCVRWSSNWRYRPDSENAINCDAFLAAADRLQHYVQHNT